MKQRAVPPVEADTRGRIITAALQVFAKNGFTSGTLREITQVAEVNIAAVNYHFRSKEDLIKYVLEDSLASVIAVRTESLDHCIAAARPGAPSVVALAEALVKPLVDLSSGQYRDVMTLLMHARTTSNELITGTVEELFQPLHEKFVDVLQKALPDLSRSELAFRYDCARGAVLQTLVSLAPAATLVSGIASLQDTPSETTTRRLVGFVTAGLSAPLA